VKNIWKESEGDNWFLRNKGILEKRLDLCLTLLNIYSIKPKRVLEIGASYGYRLARIHEKFGSKVTAVEPSQEAIGEGEKKYPFIDFFRSTGEEFETTEKFDLIIVNFVFHWVPRETLFSFVEKIDRFLDEEGYLIIGDFGVEHHLKRRYHHIKGEKIYTYKMPYWELFTKSGRYLEIAKMRFDHDNMIIRPDVSLDNLGVVSLLRKSDLFMEH